MNPIELPRLIYSAHGVGTADTSSCDVVNDDFAVKIVDAPVLVGAGFWRYQGIALCRKCRKFPILQNIKAVKWDEAGNFHAKPSDEQIARGMMMRLDVNHRCPQRVSGNA